MKPATRPRIIFITGTDTGVGKTVLTSLLIAHLRQIRWPALALKPFCSGSRADAEIMFDLQEGQLTLDEINPWFFPEPLAPLVAARLHRRRITLNQVLLHIRRINATLHHSTTPPLHHSRTPILLIEGAGGLLAPLGEGFSALDLIVRLRCEVLLVAANRLGTINHTLLSVRALRDAGCKHGVVLMDMRKRDASTTSNAHMLRELVSGLALWPIPFLRLGRVSACAIQEHTQRLRTRLHALLDAC